jgi:hypothetical protein
MGKANRLENNELTFAKSKRSQAIKMDYANGAFTGTIMSHRNEKS